MPGGHHFVGFWASRVLRLVASCEFVARPTHRKGAMNGARDLGGSKVWADQREDYAKLM
jgi:hypothetical protein